MKSRSNVNKIKVNGMHCSSCEMIIKESLEEFEGIHDVKSSHKSGVVEVDFNPDTISLDKIKMIIENEGYKVRL